MYREVPQSLGLTISVKAYRKGNNGKTASRRKNGERRNGSTGKKAVVKDKNNEVIDVIKQPNFRLLSQTLRKKYNIDPSKTIAKAGVTHL